MTTQQLGFSILSAPIAAIDRRSLSQAWYSALHLAHGPVHAPIGPAKPVPTSCASAPARGGIPPEKPSRPRPVEGATKTQAREAVRHADAREEQDRRCTRSPLARKIERAFLHPARQVRRTTLSIDGTGARVQITLQHDARGVRLVAVCPRVKRAQVARALQEARFALAARGIALDARVGVLDDVR